MKLPEERFAAKIKDIALSHSYSFTKEISQKILAFLQDCRVWFFFSFFFFLSLFLFFLFFPFNFEYLETNCKANFTANLQKIRGMTSYGDKRFHKAL